MYIKRQEGIQVYDTYRKPQCLLQRNVGTKGYFTSAPRTNNYRYHWSKRLLENQHY